MSNIFVQMVFEEVEKLIVYSFCRKPMFAMNFENVCFLFQKKDNGFLRFANLVSVNL